MVGASLRRKAVSKKVMGSKSVGKMTGKAKPAKVSMEAAKKKSPIKHKGKKMG